MHRTGNRAYPAAKSKCRLHSVFTLAINFSISSLSFLPGDSSTPLETSTQSGHAVLTAQTIFLESNPPERKKGFLIRERLSNPQANLLPVPPKEFFLKVSNK